MVIRDKRLGCRKPSHIDFSVMSRNQGLVNKIIYLGINETLKSRAGHTCGYGAARPLQLTASKVVHHVERVEVVRDTIHILRWRKKFRIEIQAEAISDD